ncbi:MAG: TonB-dependent siderophore receptor, partial [Acidovorax sp.]
MRPATSFQPAPLRPVFAATPVAVAAAVMFALAAPAVLAQQAAPAATAEGKALSTVTVNASADASAQGLSPAYAGGQVARGGRAGV